MTGEKGTFRPAQDTVRNTLLAALSPADWEMVSPFLQLVELRPRQTLHHARMPMDYVYFPERGLVSVSARIAPDQWVEVWLVGSEGMTGVPVVLGDPNEPALRRVVQVGGAALRMQTNELMRVIGQSRSIEGLFRRYIEVVLLQTAQSGACNAHHSLRQRLARWLLLARSGLQDDVLPLTHNILSRLLGVRRPSVTECLGLLQEQGAIRMSRGEIRITDPTALENICCHCHQVIKHEYQRLITNHRHNTSKK